MGMCKFYISVEKSKNLKNPAIAATNTKKLMRWPQRCGLFQPAFKENSNASYRDQNYFHFCR